MNENYILDYSSEFKSIKAHKELVKCVAMSPDEDLIASGGFDCKIILYYSVTLKPVRELTEHTSFIQTLNFTYMNKKDVLISGSNDWTIKIWDYKTFNTSIMTVDAHYLGVTCLNIS
jgi:WD40 repeat protein